MSFEIGLETRRVVGLALLAGAARPSGDVEASALSSAAMVIDNGKFGESGFASPSPGTVKHPSALAL